MKTTITLLGAMALAASLSFAQEQPAGPKKGPGGPGKGGHPAPETIFKKLDADSNGSLSLDEFKASPRGKKDPAKAEEAFKKMDTSNDGALSLEEFKAGHPKKGGAGKGGKKGGPDKGENPPAVE